MKIVFVDRSVGFDSIEDIEKPRGGMVTSLYKISDYLAKEGHIVYVLGAVKRYSETKNGVSWLPDSLVELINGRCDFLIFNRGIGSAMPEMNAKHRILWTHDLPHAGFIPDPKNIKAFSATVFMSRYGERVWRTFYKDIGKSFRIPNGVDKSIFFNDGNKDLSKLIFCSNPNRGLNRLPFIFDCIKARVDRKLSFDAYSNMSKLHPNEGEDTFSNIYNDVSESSINLHDPVPQPVLAEKLRRAGLMILPTDYPEICSNAILQSLACGTPVITTGDLGSAGEWIDKSLLTRYKPYDYMVYQVEIIRKAVEILEDKFLHLKQIRRAERTKIYDWDEIGRKWLKMLKKLY